MLLWRGYDLRTQSILGHFSFSFRFASFSPCGTQLFSSSHACFCTNHMDTDSRHGNMLTNYLRITLLGMTYSKRLKKTCNEGTPFCGVATGSWTWIRCCKVRGYVACWILQCAWRQRWQLSLESPTQTVPQKCLENRGTQNKEPWTS